MGAFGAAGFESAGAGAGAGFTAVSVLFAGAASGAPALDSEVDDSGLALLSELAALSAFAVAADAADDAASRSAFFPSFP